MRKSDEPDILMEAISRMPEFSLKEGRTRWHRQGFLVGFQLDLKVNKPLEDLDEKQKQQFAEGILAGVNTRAKIEIKATLNGRKK